MQSSLAHFDAIAAVERPRLARFQSNQIVDDCAVDRTKILDHERLAFFGVSLGARLAPIALTVEKRFQAAVLWSGGFLTPTVGASGAIFGILGAGLVLERQRDYVFGGSALGVIVINFVFTFSISGISKGGHIGGLVGGIICALGLTRFGRGHAAYGRPGLLGAATILLVGVASIAIAYWRVTSYSI